jgi:hypothetical protein
MMNAARYELPANRGGVAGCTRERQRGLSGELVGHRPIERANLEGSGGKNK